MFAPGRILYFDPFYFKNGNTAKPKYFIVLSNNSDDTLLASLPTRKDHIPGNNKIEHGCNNIDSINLCCYYFEPGRAITTNNFSFELPTFIYGSQIDNYNQAILKDVYRVEGTEYVNIGMLKKEEYENIIQCFAQSKTIKMKHKNIFKAILKDL